MFAPTAIAVDLHRDLLRRRAPGRRRRCSPSGRASREVRDAVNKEIEALRAARPGRLVAAGRGDDHGRRRRPRDLLASARRRPALRPDHVGGACAARRRRRCDRRGRRRRRARRSASAAGTGATTSATIRRTRRSAAAAPQPLRRRRAARGRPDGMARGATSALLRPGSASRWLVIVLDQITKTLIVGAFQLGDSRTDHVVLQHRARPQHRRGVLVPRRRSGLAALVLRRPRRGRGRLHRLDAAHATAASGCSAGRSR